MNYNTYIYIRLTLLVPEAGWFGLLRSAEKARHFETYFVHFSSRKTAPLSGSWKHPHKYQRKVKAFIFQGLPCLLQAVTKISTVHKFHKGRVAADRHWQF